MSSPRCAQATTPEHWDQLWVVSGWVDECEHAQRVCEVLGYERDDDDRSVVRVRFIEQRDLFEPMEALLSPHMLFPHQAPAVVVVPGQASDHG